MLRMDERAREAIAAGKLRRVSRVVAVVAGAGAQEAGREADGLLASRRVAPERLDRPARVGARPLRAHDAMPEADPALEAGLARRVLDVGADRAAVRDRLRLRPGPERVAHGEHVGVGADAGIAEEIPRAADPLAAFEDREGLPRCVAREMPGGVDAREARADDQDVEVLDAGSGHRGPPRRSAAVRAPPQFRGPFPNGKPAGRCPCPRAAGKPLTQDWYGRLVARAPTSPAEGEAGVRVPSPNEEVPLLSAHRFEDYFAAFLDPATYSSTWGTSLEFMDGPKDAMGLMIYMDAPRHTRYRKLVSKVFTPGRVAALEPMIRALAIAHLDALVGRPRFDVVREFTARLPMDVISTMLGIPRRIARGATQGQPDAAPRARQSMPVPEAIRAVLELNEYWTAQIEERRRRPKDDLMTKLVEVEMSGEDGGPQRLGDDEIRSFFILLATAGNETVTKLLATALHELAKNPEQREILAREPGWIPNAVEETLRFDPPSQYQGRTTTRAVEWHGQRIPERSRVLLINGASGRDERRFPDPDRYDVRREIDVQLGFGYGRHICLGASLARLESRICLEEFLRRWPVYRIPPEGIERMHSSNVRGFSGLVVEAA